MLVSVDPVISLWCPDLKYQPQTGPCAFFARKKHKKIKELVNASTFEAGNAIFRAADQQGDEDMLLVLRGVNKDLVAAEAKYHKSCYSSYVSKTKLQYTGFKEETLESTYASTFNELAGTITADILTGKALFRCSAQAIQSTFRKKIVWLQNHKQDRS
jgi:hypothetical protein